MSLSSVDQKRAMRFQYLEELYRLSGGNPMNDVEDTEIQNKFGWTVETLDEISEYLKGEGLVAQDAFGRAVHLTHRGVVTYEEAVSHPKERTDYFPPVNIIHIEHMAQSQIQQGTSHSAQQMNAPGIDWSGLRSLLPELRAAVAAVDPAVAADVATVEAQVASPTPRAGLIRELLVSVRSTLEKGAGTAVGAQLADWMQKAGWIQP